MKADEILAQWNHPAPRGEWTEQTRLDLEEFDISDDLQWIKRKSKFAFQKLGEAKAKELTLELNKRLFVNHFIILPFTIHMIFFPYTISPFSPAALFPPCPILLELLSLCCNRPNWRPHVPPSSVLSIMSTHLFLWHIRDVRTKYYNNRCIWQLCHTSFIIFHTLHKWQICDILTMTFDVKIIYDNMGVNPASGCEIQNLNGFDIFKKRKRKS